MKKPSRGRTYRSKLQGLYSFLMSEDDPSAVSAEERRTFLEAHGVNVDRQIDWVHDRLAAARAEERLAAARTTRERELERFHQMHKERATPPMIAQVREKVQELLELLSAKNPQLVAGYFRRFEDASEADLESMLQDLHFLQDGENNQGAMD